MSKKIRTRIAPSPTGNLHVGTARAALFNELFARAHGGAFIVRIEDTDTERSRPAFEQNILDGLTWLGLTWDEGPDVGGSFGPYRQSERGDLYSAAITQLLAEDKAYQHVNEEAVYLRVTDEDITFADAVRGQVTVNPQAWGGDFVIARTPTHPVFHLAVVVDDAAMAISHVIRGEDHISNTARHILLQRALGYAVPIYAHLPLLLDSNRRKLSKRAGEVTVLSYRDAGYLPEAMLNYLAFLGWNPKTDQEFFTHDELIKAFKLEDVQKSGAIFNPVKLAAINRHYLGELSDDQLFEWGSYHYQQTNRTIQDKNRFLQALKTERGRFSSYEVGGVSLADALSWYEVDGLDDYDQKLLIWRKSDAATTRSLIEQLLEKLNSFTDDDFTKEALENTLLAWIDAKMLGRGDTLWPMRVALTGRSHSPSPFEVAAVLGKKETLKRLTAARDKLSLLSD